MKQPIPGKQFVSMTNASFRSAGYALMIEDNHTLNLSNVSRTKHKTDRVAGPPL